MKPHQKKLLLGLMIGIVGLFLIINLCELANALNTNETITYSNERTDFTKYLGLFMVIMAVFAGIVSAIRLFND